MRFQKLASVFLGILFLLGAGARLASAADNPQEKQPKEEFAAWANNLGGAVKSGQVLITIERWSSPEERNQLIAAFNKGGQEEMMKVLTKFPSVGFIRLPRTLSYELHYAYQWPQPDGGRIIIIATDRKISAQEVRSNPISMDYPYELIQMEVNKEGKGEGRVSWATKISKGKDGIELENYSTAQVVLQSVHMIGDSAKEKEKEKEPEK